MRLQDGVEEVTTPSAPVEACLDDTTFYNLDSEPEEYEHPWTSSEEEVSITNGNFQQAREMSRVKRRHTHPAYWHMKKNRTHEEEDVTTDNRNFVKEVVQDRYGVSALPGAKVELPQDSPLQGLNWVPGEWVPKSFRTGVIAKNIGCYPMWEKDGTKVLCTLLQVLDNHVVKYVPPEEYIHSIHGLKHHRKTRLNLGCLVVGAEATDPQKFTRQYCSLFSGSGLMPKKRLTRFIISPNAALLPGTPLTAAHYRIGDFVDVAGKTIDYGFQGAVKRWGMKGGPASHGTTKAHRRVGSIGGGGEKARVWPGTKMPGHMGSARRTMRGLEILRINYKYNVLYVRGTVPGITNSHVNIYDTVLPLKKPTTPPCFPTFMGDPDKLEEEVFASCVHEFGAPNITV
nr:EOG090X07HN [Lepidurus arcticus]